MSTFTVKFDCDNEVFSASKREAEREIVRILRAIADRVERDGCSGFFETIRDSHGNDVGRFALKPAS